jgi:RimJ/RimL family protein N-acetyltransferase
MNITHFPVLTHDTLYRLARQNPYRVVNLIAMRPFIEKQLCSSLDPSICYSPFFRGVLPGDPREFSVRPFCIPQDLPVIYNWIKGYWNDRNDDTSSPVQQLLEAYHDLLTADYSQSLIAEVGEKPILQIDIVRADQDEISLEEDIQPGDYSIHFLFPPQFEESEDYFASALHCCLDSFFSFPEVRRIFCKAHVPDDRSNRLLRDAGFVFDKKVKNYSVAVNIYCYEQMPAIAG